MKSVQMLITITVKINALNLKIHVTNAKSSECFCTFLLRAYKYPYSYAIDEDLKRTVALLTQLSLENDHPYAFESQQYWMILITTVYQLDLEIPHICMVFW